MKGNKTITADTVIDVIGTVCPIPLVETRKAMKESKRGEVIEIMGTHEASKHEIPMAVESAGSKVLKVTEEEGIWHIFIEK